MHKINTWVMNHPDPELLLHYCTVVALGGVILLVATFVGLVLL